MLPDDSTVYVVKDPSNTITPQPLYLKKPNDDLIQTGKDATYDGHGGGTRDKRLRGGTDSSKDARNHRISQAKNKLVDARKKVGEAQREVTKQQAKVIEANTAKANADKAYEKAAEDYGAARKACDDFFSKLDRHAALTPDAAKEVWQLKQAEDQKKASLTTASRALETATRTQKRAVENAQVADTSLATWKQAVTVAEAALYAAENASF